MTTRNRELASIIDASGNITTGGNLSVAGDLTQTTSNTTSYSDGLLELNTGASSNSNDLGLVMERGSTGDNAIFLWDESNDGFAVGTTTVVGTATGNISFSAAPFTASTITGTTLTGSTSVKTPLIEYTDGDDAITIADGGHITTGGNLSIGGSNNELRFYEGSNYVGFEAPALSADKIWVLPAADGSANQILKTDGSGNLSFTDDLTLANASVNNYSGNGSATGFTLSTTPVSENATQAYINGVYQFKNTYSVSGTTFTFDTAPPNGSSIEVLVWSTVAVNVPATASVTNVSLNASIITGQSVVTAAQGDHVLIYDASATALKKALVSDFGNTDEEIQDLIGAMFSSNTETGISVTYQDGDGTLDLVIGDDTIVSSMLDTNIDIAGTLDVTGVLTTDTNAVIAGTLGIAGSSTNGIAISQGAIKIKNGGYKSYIDFYCESSNAHYTRVEAAAHGAYSGNVTATLPVATGTLALTSDIQTTEELQDIIGAMFSSNTETGIAATYQDGDGTIDLVVGDDTIVSSMLDTNIAIAGTLDVAGAVVFNEGSADVDFRVESNGDANALFVNGGTNRVGIGTASPAAKLDVSGVFQFFDDTTPEIKIIDSDDSNYALLGYSDGTINLSSNHGNESGGANVIKFSTGGTERARVDNNGNVTATKFNGIESKIFGTGSIMIGDTTTGTINAADSNTGLGIDIFAALTTGDDNVAVGFSALKALTTGSSNTAVGTNALLANTTGQRNVAVGRMALKTNTEGDFNTALGRDALFGNTTADSNTGVGYGVLYVNQTGTANTAVGYQALDACTSSSNNTAVGFEALTTLTSGVSLTAVGKDALKLNTTGDQNTAFGASALAACEDGHTNTAIGEQAGKSITSGDENVAIGHGALDGGNTCSGNVAIGTDAMGGAVAGQGYNTAVGYNAMLVSTSASGTTAIGNQCLDALTTGNDNTGVGAGSLTANLGGAGNTALGKSSGAGITTGGQNVAIGVNTFTAACTGDNNVGVGPTCGQAMTSGAGNTMVGQNAGNSITTGASNVAIGVNALHTLTASTYPNIAIGENALHTNNGGTGQNTAVGYRSGEALTTAEGNTFYGSYTGLKVNTGNSNVLIGSAAGGEILGGSNNVCVGNSAGVTTTTGSDNVSIGVSADTGHSGSVNRVTMGKSAVGSADNAFVIGNAGTDSRIVMGETSITAPSDIRLKEDIQDETIGLDFLNDLRPVTFLWKKEKDVPEGMKSYVADSEKRVMNGKHNHGFIAQEVKAVIDNYDMKDGFGMWQLDDTENSDSRQRVSDNALISIMVKSIQELTARVKELEGK